MINRFFVKICDCLSVPTNNPVSYYFNIPMMIANPLYSYVFLRNINDTNTYRSNLAFARQHRRKTSTIVDLP
ncbi:MAG: hypothetical protein LBQ08_02830 [Holosporaceae bacterium]|nr:hypothetical protein [Holosporaceae bacterium]